MKWMEFIKVQTTGAQGQTGIPVLREISASLKKTLGLIGVEVYEQSSVCGDFAVLLFWETDQLQQEGSMEGLNLKHVLKQFGLVNHSVWIIKES